MNKSWNIAAVSALLLFAALPLLLSLGYAVLYSLGFVGALSNGFTLEHWQKLFADASTLTSFFYSAAIALVSVGLSVSLALFIALRHGNAFRKGALSSIIYLPLAFPALVSAFVVFQALSKAGAFSRISYGLGLTRSIDAFPDLVNDYWGVGIVTAHLFLCGPFFVLLFINRIQTERVNDYLQVAESLGAARQQALRRIAVPLLLKKTIPNILLYFIFIFGSYEIPILLGRSNPEMVSVLAVRKLQKFNLFDIPQGYVVAVLYSVITLTLLVFALQKQKAAHDS